MSKKGNGEVLDEEVKKEIRQAGAETDIMGSWTTDGDQSDKIPLVTDWMPGKDQWQGKTAVTPEQTVLMAVARNLPKAYDEIEDMAPFIDGLLTDLEMYLTSIDGGAREEHKHVLMSMFGSDPKDESGASILARAFSNNDNDD